MCGVILQQGEDLLLPEPIQIPAWVADRASFLRWAESDEFPEHGRIDYLQGQIWVDLSQEFLGCQEKSALCHAVVIAEPGRRSSPKFTDLTVSRAQEALRHHWPIADVHAASRCGMLANRLSQLCRCAQVQLSHDPAELVLMLETARTTEPHGAPRVILSVNNSKWQTAA